MCVCQPTMLSIACLLMVGVVKVTSLLIVATLVWFGDRVSTDMKIWCVKGMYMLSLVPRPEEEEEEKGSETR